MDFEEQSPRICWYNTNPITLGAIGLAIQCVYEGSFLWLVRATHPYLEGDYYMEDDCLPDPVPSLPDPVPMPISTGKKQHPMPTEDVGTPTNIDSSSYPVPPLTPPQMSEMAEPSPQKYSTARNTPHSPSPAIVTSSPTEPLVVNPLNSADTTKQISNPPPSDKAEDRKGVTNHVPASEESYPGLQNPSTPPLYTPLSDKFLSPLHEPYEVKTPREDPVFIVNLPLPHNDEHELSLLPPLDLDFPSLLGIKEKTSRRDRKRRLHEPNATFSHDLLKKSGYHSSTKKKKWTDMTTEEQDEELYGPQTDSVRFDPTGTGRHRSQRDRRSRHRGRTHHTVDTPSPERRDDSPPPPPSTPHPSHAYLQRSLPSPKLTPPSVPQQISYWESGITEVQGEIEILKAEREESRRRKKLRKKNRMTPYGPKKAKVRFADEDEAPQTIYTDIIGALGLSLSTAQVDVQLEGPISSRTSNEPSKLETPLPQEKPQSQMSAWQLGSLAATLPVVNPRPREDSQLIDLLQNVQLDDDPDQPSQVVPPITVGKPVIDSEEVNLLESITQIQLNGDDAHEAQSEPLTIKIPPPSRFRQSRR